MPDELDPQSHLGEIDIDEFALAHRIPRDQLLAVRNRVEDVYNASFGSLRSPILAEMVAADWDPRNAVQWLLECDLEEESRRLTLWEYVTSPSAPLTPVAQLPGLCDAAIQFLRRNKPSIRSSGDCDGASNWIEFSVGRAWRAGLFALREMELEGQDDPILRPQDRGLVPDARELLVDLRLLLLNESSIALEANSPATLWGRALHKWPGEADLAFLRLAQRLDSALKGLDPDDDISPFDDLFRLAVHFEYEALFGDWSDLRDAIDGIGPSRSYYAHWTGETWASVWSALEAWRSTGPRRERFRAERTRSMLRSLRTMARARGMRLAWRVAAGDADDEIPAVLGRWELPARSRERATSGTRARSETPAPVVVTLNPTNTFMIGGRPLKWKSGERWLMVRAGIDEGKLLRRVVEEGEWTGEVDSRVRTNLKKALESATAGPNGPQVLLARKTSRPTRPIVFSDDARRKLLAIPLE